MNLWCPASPANAISGEATRERIVALAHEGIDRRPDDPEQARAHFGGTPAPELRLILDGAHSALG